MEKYILEYGNEKIEYYLVRKNVKNINLNVKRDGKVYVSANPKVPKNIIDDFVLKKGNWILKNIKYFKKISFVQVGEREYVSGESYVFMGNQYRLKVVEKQEEGIKIIDDYIYLFVKNKNAVHKKRWMLTRWYKEQTTTNLTNIFNETCNKYKNQFPIECELQIRLMKSRWGSFNCKNNKITLNSNLIYAPKYCIEYVIVHELCHYKHHNHGKAYYELLENLIPDWKIRKKILDEEVIRNIKSGIN